MIKLILAIILIFGFANQAWSVTYKWVDKGGKTHYTNDLGTIPKEIQGTIKQIGKPLPVKNPEIKKPKVIPEKIFGKNKTEIKPATKKEKYNFEKNIMKAYRIKDPTKRQKAFNSLFYLEGVAKSMRTRYEKTIVSNLTSLKKPKVSFGKLPKDYTGVVNIDGKEYVNNVKELGLVVFDGLVVMPKVNKLFPAKLKVPYGRQGDELVIPGFILR